MSENVYAAFLLTKAALNIGAGITAALWMGDAKMAGFWLAVGAADAWFGIWSLR